MQTLDALIATAKQFEQPMTRDEAEVARQMTICNACRYCEGYCAVFPAMTKRLEFNAADTHYLANLCHNCSACLHACQYAPPHAFAINVPRAMSKVRVQTYQQYAWPKPLARLYKNNGLTLSLSLAFGLGLFLSLAAIVNGFTSRPVALTDTTVPATVAPNFYSIFPHQLMVSLFAPIFTFALIALMLGVTKFWRSVSSEQFTKDRLTAIDRLDAQKEASSAVLSLKYLGGGHGEGCNEQDDRYSLVRRRFHHAVFYGFLLCFASTSTATIYHYVFGWIAPYGYLSLPKLFGISGGVLLSIGCIGLLRLNQKKHELQNVPEHKAMDLGFVALLLLTGVSGLALMLAKNTSAMPLSLCIHLGAVMALFITMPYSKFAHGVYRSAALLKFAIEKRQPDRLKVPSGS